MHLDNEMSIRVIEVSLTYTCPCLKGVPLCEVTSVHLWSQKHCGCTHTVALATCVKILHQEHS